MVPSEVLEDFEGILCEAETPIRRGRRLNSTIVKPYMVLKTVYTSCMLQVNTICFNMKLSILWKSCLLSSSRRTGSFRALRRSIERMELFLILSCSSSVKVKNPIPLSLGTATVESLYDIVFYRVFCGNDELFFLFCVARRGSAHLV